MNDPVYTAERPAKVEVIQGRWGIRLVVTLDDGTEEIRVASADHGVTWGDGIFFGTPEEFDEAIGRV